MPKSNPTLVPPFQDENIIKITRPSSSLFIKVNRVCWTASCWLLDSNEQLRGDVHDNIFNLTNLAACTKETSLALLVSFVYNYFSARPKSSLIVDSTSRP